MKELFNRFYSSPRPYQRLIVLSVLTMFLSHLSVRTVGSGFDLFMTVFQVMILGFIVGWSWFTGDFTLKFFFQIAGIFVCSIETHRLIFSRFYPNTLDVMGSATLDYKIISIVFILFFYVTCLTGKSVYDIAAGVKRPEVRISRPRIGLVDFVGRRVAARKERKRSETIATEIHPVEKGA